MQGLTKNNLLLLWLCRDIGLKRIGKMVQDHTINALFETPHCFKKQYQLSHRAMADLTQPPRERLQQHLDWAGSSNHHIITLLDTYYPEALKQIYDPPPVLLVNGNATLLADPQMAIVGSRHMSYYGADSTDFLVKGLVQAGLTITSGLAYGVDAQAHKAALKQEGYTIAVLGTGMDQIYPRAHQRLAADIIRKGGALISEFPLGVGVHRGNFPKRNRVITGLSLGVLIIEASMKSGSLISARLAMEQNREVFAVPGSICNPLSVGPHWLISQGAKIVCLPGDILEALALPLRAQLKNSAKNSLQTESDGGKNKHLVKQDLLFLACIETVPTSVDAISKRCDLPTDSVLSKLLTFELKGLVSKVPGGYIRRRDD